MTIVQRFYITEYLKLLGIIGPGLALIFSLLDLIDKVDNFVPGRLTIGSIIHYILLIMPKYLLYLLPMSLLMSVLFVFGLASRNRELTAVKASGGKISRLFSPFIMLGILLSVFAFVTGEYAVPEFSQKLLEFRKEYMAKGERVAVAEGSVWLRGYDGSIVRFELYVPEKRLAQGISIFFWEEGSLRKRIEARTAKWSTPATTAPAPAGPGCFARSTRPRWCAASCR